mgnify:CR=1 FL=1|uniref:Spore coat protein CotJB n=1 Tax=Ammonifex degensii TaxID=42838 RepID=A0A7C2IQH0_9THEO
MHGEQMKMLKKIQAVEFSATELTLYLDTHPDDRAALGDYNRLASELMELKKRYTEKYGPLCVFGHGKSEDRWKWLDEPWPWEIESEGGR